MPRTVLSVFIACLVFFSFLIAPVDLLATDFSGEWQGSYTSAWYTELSGTLRGTFTQNGNQLTGTVDITDSGCTPEYDLPIYDGSAIGDTAEFKVDMNCYDPETQFSGSVTSYFVGSKSTGPFAGTYSAWVKQDPSDVMDQGSFSMTRSALEVQADFQASPVSGPAPLAVSFTNMFQGEYSTFSWSFGDGGTSTQENPSHTYNTAGTYTVSLTVSGVGGTDTETKTEYINVGKAAEPPVADFSGSPTSDLAPATVDFTDMSTGTVTGWSWTFEEGDPGTSSQQNPTNILFFSPGTYTVTLTVTGPGGSDTETKTGYITVEDPRPVADFTAEPTSGMAPLSVQFTDLSTGNVTSRSWTFDDGQTSTATNPLVIYKNPGKYTVSLTVTSPVPAAPENKTKTRTDYITVSYPPPVAKFSADKYQVPAALEVHFTDQSTGNITSWAWNFGDGTPASDAQSPTHTYNATGLYPVTLQVTGKGGSSSSSSSVFVYEIMYVNKNDGTCGGNSPCRITLQAAVNDCSRYALIKATQDNYGEDVKFSPEGIDLVNNKIIMLQGGYDTAFDTNQGVTTINQLTLGKNATLMVEKLSVQGGGVASASAGLFEGVDSNAVASSGAGVSAGVEGKLTAGWLAEAVSGPRNGEAISSSPAEGLYLTVEALEAFYDLVGRIIRTASGRDPDPEEVAAAADYALEISLEYKVGLAYGVWEIARSLFLSGCRESICVDESMVAALHKAILGRDSSSDERAYWLARRAGVNSIIYALIGSEEFVKGNPAFSGISHADYDQSILCAAFIALLDRLPDPGELDMWESYPSEALIDALLVSEEFSDRALSEAETALRVFLFENDMNFGPLGD